MTAQTISPFRFDSVELVGTATEPMQLLRKGDEWFLIVYEDDGHEAGFNCYRSDERGAVLGQPIFFADGEDGYKAARVQLQNDLKKRGYE